MRHHVFLSYSRSDTHIMQRVRDDLRAAGLIVWTDEGIHPGATSWKETIEQALREAGLVVVLLSPDANTSKWVQREIDYAEVQGKQIVPLLVRGDPRAAIPFALAGAQYIDLRENGLGYQRGIARLLRRCWHLLPAHQAMTLPSPAAPETVLSPRTARQRGRIRTLLIVFGLLLMLIGGTVVFAAVWPSTAPDDFAGERLPSTVTAVPETGVLLRYTGQSLVLYNGTENYISVYDLTFERPATDSTPLTTFVASAWVETLLRPGRCAQLWPLADGYLSPHVPPADVCISRSSYRAERDTFWQGSRQGYFSVRDEWHEIGRCPTVNPDSTKIQTCALNWGASTNP